MKTTKAKKATLDGSDFPDVYLRYIEALLMSARENNSEMAGRVMEAAHIDRRLTRGDVREIEKLYAELRERGEL